MTLLEPHNMPFAAALVLMLILGIVQVVGLADMFGGDADFDPGGDIDGDAAVSPGLVDGLFSLIGMNRLPLTIWLALFLMLFAGVGVSLQLLSENLTGSPLNRWLAAVLAMGGTLPATGVLSRPLGAILPQDETSAVSTASLVGRRAQITDGTARSGFPARAKVRDVHGQAHFVMVEPHEQGSEFRSGDRILLVRRDGNTFYATALADRRLSPVN